MKKRNGESANFSSLNRNYVEINEIDEKNDSIKNNNQMPLILTREIKGPDPRKKILSKSYLPKIENCNSRVSLESDQTINNNSIHDLIKFYQEEQIFKNSGLYSLNSIKFLKNNFDKNEQLKKNLTRNQCS